MPRPPRNAPVPAPPGYRWHFNTKTFLNCLGVLELVDDSARTDDHGMHWLYVVPAGKRKPKPQPTFSRVSRPIDRERQIRRVSRSLVREHYALAAQEHTAALAAARISASIPNQEG